ncbi:MAG: TolC family protein [Planctomycetota bacterium]
MARSIPTLTRVLLIGSFASCSSYTPAPLEPVDLLQDLRAQPAIPLPSEGLTPQIATLTALAHNPDLQAMRQSVGIADSVLMEAGLWPDLQLGWGAMDWVVGGTSDDALTGASIMLPLFRPDERDALLADAEASLDLVRTRLLETEWRLTRQVQRQYLDLAEALDGLQLAQQASDLAKQTSQLLKGGVESGAATRFDLEFSRLQQAESLRNLQAQERRMDMARVRLNGLMGLAPQTQYQVLPLQTLESSWAIPQVSNAEELVDLALEQRPDIQARQAEYQIAEAALRLEVAQQWPLLGIGTGISLRLPLFRKFNSVAIRTASLARDQAASRLQSSITGLRNEAWMVLRNAEGQTAEWTTIHDVATPALERSFQLSQQAQEMGALSFLDVLLVQHQLLAAQREALTVHANALRAQADLAWFLGLPAPTNTLDR